MNEPEAIPRHIFWGDPSAEPVLLIPGSPGHGLLDRLRCDAEAVFTARTRDNGAAYSVGVMYFLPCQMRPRCALEGLVQSIFQAHTAHLSESAFNVETSGSEWWTLVMDDSDDTTADNKTSENQAATNDDADHSNDERDDDEVGMHFDADYGVEAKAPGFLLHPRLATVTYLSDFGAPTVIWDRKSAPQGHLDALTGPIHRAWLSHPKIGKHIAFDGRLLHGAPTVFFPAAADAATVDSDTELSQKAKRTQKQDHRRITLLVNIWLNHCPLDAELLDEQVIMQLTTPWDSANEPTLFTWNQASINRLTNPPKKSTQVKLFSTTSREMYCVLK